MEENRPDSGRFYRPSSAKGQGAPVLRRFEPVTPSVLTLRCVTRECVGVAQGTTWWRMASVVSPSSVWLLPSNTALPQGESSSAVDIPAA